MEIFGAVGDDSCRAKRIAKMKRMSKDDDGPAWTEEEQQLFSSRDTTSVVSLLREYLGFAALDRSTSRAHHASDSGSGALHT
eukprot:5071265-Prymnesium_polylepis.1